MSLLHGSRGLFVYFLPLWQASLVTVGSPSPCRFPCRPVGSLFGFPVALSVPLLVSHASLSCIHKLESVFCRGGCFFCHHLRTGRSYSLILWRDCADDFEWHSSSSTLLFLRTRRLCNHWKKFCVLWHFSWHPYNFFLLRHQVPWLRRASSTNSLMISPPALSLNIPGTFLLIPVGIPEEWFGVKFEESIFSWTSAEMSLKKSSVSIS